MVGDWQVSLAEDTGALFSSRTTGHSSNEIVRREREESTV
jgi:hypothetical protein